MNLPSDLISQFVKITNDKPTPKKESTVYGTTVEYDGDMYVKIDGSELLTPITTTADTKAGERVTVMIKNHTATVTGNISSPAARTEDVQNISLEAETIGRKITEFEIAIGEKVDTEELNAERARIDTLVSENVTIKETLTARDADIDTLLADNVTIKESLTARDAEIENLQTTKLDAEIADLTYATIGDLNATNVNVNNLNATYGNISLLMFGSASGTSLQTSFANAVVALLGDAQIKSAMIESVSADKITAGDIITNNVRVMSEDGKLLISDETIQISDDTRVRVQIGKDASNDYSINIWDADGKLMFSEGGITDSAIKEAIIRNDMISDDANIAAHKLDIDSLFDEINDSTKTIKSTKVYFDDEAQTLDVAFKAMSSDVDGLQNDVITQGTQISAIQGQISSKVWQEDIDTAKGEMSTQYSTLKQSVDSVSLIVADHTSQISGKADTSIVTSVSNKVTSLEQNIDGFKMTVNSTYATKTDVNDIKVGGRNLIPGSKDLNGTGSTNYNSKTVLDNGFTAFKCTGNWHGVKRNANDLILDSKDGDVFTFSVNIKTSDACSLSFYAMCYTSDKQRVYPETASGQFNSKTLMTTKSEEDQDQRAHITFQVTQGWIDLINDGGTIDWTLQVHDGASSTNPAYLYAPKLERGNKSTDWTPAPEDITSEMDAAMMEVEEVAAAVESTSERITSAEALIEILSESISMLVTDSNGASLMTQTENGWTFSTADIQTLINRTSESLNDLTNEVGNVGGTVDILQQAVADLGTIADYVTIGTYENEPCIELGEGDSEFKLRITNTRMVFTEGPNVLAYFNNQSLHIKKAVVEDELQQGGFVWKVRSNGNMGLTWKGGNS